MKIALNSHLSFQGSSKAPLCKAAELLLPATGTHYKITKIAGNTLTGEVSNQLTPKWKTALKVVACVLAFPLAFAALAVKVHFLRNHTLKMSPVLSSVEGTTSSTASSSVSSTTERDPKILPKEVKDLPPGFLTIDPAESMQWAGQINLLGIPERHKFPETREEFLGLQSMPGTNVALHRMIEKDAQSIDLVNQKTNVTYKSLFRVTKPDQSCYYFADPVDLNQAPVGVSDEEIISYFFQTWREQQDQVGPLFIPYGSGAHARLLVFERGEDPMEIYCINVDSFGSNSLPKKIRDIVTSDFRATEFLYSTLPQQNDGHKCFSWTLMNMFHLIRNLPDSPKRMVEEQNLASIKDLKQLQRDFAEQFKLLAALGDELGYPD